MIFFVCDIRQACSTPYGGTRILHWDNSRHDKDSKCALNTSQLVQSCPKYARNISELVLSCPVQHTKKNPMLSQLFLKNNVTQIIFSHKRVMFLHFLKL